MVATNTRSIALIAAAFISTPALAQSVPFEPNARMDKDLSRGLIDPAVSMIRARGWKCDSISALVPFLLSRGFSVTCNNSLYRYNFEDKGGNWEVSLD